MTGKPIVLLPILLFAGLALAALSTAARAAGDFADNVKMAQTAYEAEDYETASKYFKLALAEKPDHVTLNFNLAVSLEMLDDLEGAAQHYAKYLELSPDAEDADEVQGWIDGIEAELKDRREEADRKARLEAEQKARDDARKKAEEEKANQAKLEAQSKEQEAAKAAQMATEEKKDKLEPIQPKGEPEAAPVEQPARPRRTVSERPGDGLLLGLTYNVVEDTDNNMGFRIGYYDNYSRFTYEYVKSPLSIGNLTTTAAGNAKISQFSYTYLFQEINNLPGYIGMGFGWASVNLDRAACGAGVCAGGSGDSSAEIHALLGYQMTSNVETEASYTFLAGSDTIDGIAKVGVNLLF